MTIKQFADEQGISKGTVYNAVKRSRFNLGQITNAAGEITPEGLTILQSLFNLRRDQGETRQQNTQGDSERLQDEIAELKDSLRRAEERAEQWEKRYLELQDSSARERAELLQQVNAAQKLVYQEQEIRRISLMNPFKRLFAGKREPIITESQVK